MGSGDKQTQRGVARRVGRKAAGRVERRVELSKEWAERGEAAKSRAVVKPWCGGVGAKLKE